MISELGIGIATSIFGLALYVFWKRALHMENSIQCQIFSVFTHKESNPSGTQALISPSDHQ